MEVALLTVKVVAAVAPNFTAVAPVKLVPVTATDVPPVVGPEAGLTAVTVGSVEPELVAVMRTATAPERPAGLWRLWVGRRR